MQHSLFDRIYIAFLVILIISFGFLIFFIAYFTRRSLVDEKRATLTNEAMLIASQSVSSYTDGTMTANDLASFSKTLESDIWYVDDSGKLIATSGYFDSYRDADKDGKNDSANDPAQSGIAIMKDLPKSIYNIDSDYDITSNYSMVSTFYGIYNRNVITVNQVAILATPSIIPDFYDSLVMEL